jgi:hypothetical protein
MVKRKSQTKTKSDQNQQADEGLSAAETIIDAQMEAGSLIFGKFSRAEIISGSAALLSLIAVGLALWPVLTTKLANERQAELSARVDAISSALESLVTAQTQLAKTVVEQRGLSGALKTDIEKLTAQASEQAETLAVNLRAELESLSQKVQETQKEVLESLNLRTLSAEKTEKADDSANITNNSAKRPANPNGPDSAPDSQLNSQPLAADETWVPKWLGAALAQVADWFSGLVTIRKTEDAPDAASQGSQSSSESTSQ